MRLGMLGRERASGKMTASVTLVVGGIALLGSGTDSRASLTSVPGSVLASTVPLLYAPGSFGPVIRQFNQFNGQQIGQVGCFRVGAADLSIQGVATIGSSVFATYVASNGFSLVDSGVGRVNTLTGEITPLATAIPEIMNGELGLAARDNRLIIQSRRNFAEVSLDGTISPVLTANGTSQQLTNMNFALDVAWNGTNYLINMYRASDVNPVNTIYSIDPVTGTITGEVIPPAALPSVNQSLDFDIPTGIMRSSGTFFENGAWVWGIRNLTPTPGYFDSVLNNGTPTFTDIATWNIPSPAPATLGLLLAGRIALRQRR